MAALKKEDGEKCKENAFAHHSLLDVKLVQLSDISSDSTIYCVSSVMVKLTFCFAGILSVIFAIRNTWMPDT